VELRDGEVNRERVARDTSNRMISALRTYRTLPGLLALLMMVSVALPVLCQVCAPADAAAAEHTAMHTTHEAGHDAPAHCLHGHDKGHAPSDAHAPHNTSECDGATCTMMADEPAPAVLQTERAVPAAQDAPVLVAQAVAPFGAASTPPARVHPDQGADHHLHIPVRLQTASFLL